MNLQINKTYKSCFSSCFSFIVVRFGSCHSAIGFTLQLLLLNFGNFPPYTIIPPYNIIKFWSFSTLYYYYIFIIFHPILLFRPILLLNSGRFPASYYYSDLYYYLECESSVLKSNDVNEKMLRKSVLEVLSMMTLATCHMMTN